MSKWVITGYIEGSLFIPRHDNNLPVRKGSKFITKYAVYKQNLFSRFSKKTLLLGLDIDDDLDHVYIAYQEMEAFVRSLGIIKDTSISVRGLHMTDNIDEWPEGIAFVKASRHIKPEGWGPYLHHQDPKNRIRHNGIGEATILRNENQAELQELHMTFIDHNFYQSELVKDYLIGLETQNIQPSLAVLYFFKVIERVAKEKYGESPGKTLTRRILVTMIEDVGEALTPEETDMAINILRWRNTKSEAHLLDEGMPSRDEVKLCRKIAKIFIEKYV